MKRIALALCQLPVIALSAPAPIDVTPDTAKHLGLAVRWEIAPTALLVGNKPGGLAGHLYRFILRSDDVNLTKCKAVLRITDNDESFLQAVLHTNPHARKIGALFCDVLFSSNYLDKAYVVVGQFTPESPASYRLRVHEWVKGAAKGDDRSGLIEVAEFSMNNVLVALGQSKKEVRAQIAKPPFKTPFGGYLFLKPKESMFPGDRWVLTYTKEHGGHGRADTLRLTFEDGKVHKLEHKTRFMP